VADIFLAMLTIRIAGPDLVEARRKLGWSRYELARRSGVNWRTVKSYETAGDIAPASVGTLTRLVDTLERAGIQFEADGVHLDPPTIKSAIINDGAVA
jgi:predicted transcriptional regulator